MFGENKFYFKVRSHLATTTQIFDVVSMSSGMGCIVTNIKCLHMTTEKNTSLSSSAETALESDVS